MLHRKTTYAETVAPGLTAGDLPITRRTLGHAPPHEPTPARAGVGKTELPPESCILKRASYLLTVAKEVKRIQYSPIGEDSSSTKHSVRLRLFENEDPLSSVSQRTSARRARTVRQPTD